MSSMNGVVIGPEYTSVRLPATTRPGSRRPWVVQVALMAPGDCAGSAR